MPTPAQILQSERLRFPSMLPAEAIVWLAWLEKHESEYTGYLYNHRLGPGIDPGPAVPEKYRALGILTTQLRADAVAFQGDQPFIFEVKRRAKHDDVGQLLGYGFEWVREVTGGLPPKLVLVYNTAQAGLEDFALAHGVTPVQVEADFSRLRAATATQRAGVNPK